MELAIFTDCRTLVQNFVQRGNPLFLAFCYQWKAMMFQHIFSAQSSTTEVLETTLAALHVAKRMLCNEETDECDSKYSEKFLERLGALYLLYALYYKQPTERYNKIDVTLDGWQKIRNFIEKLDVGDRALDGARFIFWKLYQDNAFRLCAHEFHLGLENLVDYDSMQNKSEGGSAENAKQTENLLKELKDLRETKSMLPALTTLEEGYNEMKELLVKNQSRIGSTLDSQALPSTNIFKDVQKVFNDIQKILIAPITEIPQKPSREETRDKLALKRKGYLIQNIGEETVKDPLAASDAEESVKRRQMGRMSAKTLFTEALPTETLEDLEIDDSDDEDQDYEVAEDANVRDDQEVEVYDISANGAATGSYDMPDCVNEEENAEIRDQKDFMAN